MTLVQFLVIVVIGGLIWFLIDRYLPLPDPVRLVLRIVGIILLIFLLLALFGVMSLPFKIA